MAKKGKMSDAEIKKLLKAEEDKAREEAVKQVEEKSERKVEQSVTFDVWYGGRQADIPAHHRKEVIKADFRARGLEGLKTRKEWDQALEAYGVKLA